jgi:hypothetical protein
MSASVLFLYETNASEVDTRAVMMLLLILAVMMSSSFAVTEVTAACEITHIS